jgi:hypothetical protein
VITGQADRLDIGMADGIEAITRRKGLAEDCSRCR